VKETIFASLCKQDLGMAAQCLAYRGGHFSGGFHEIILCDHINSEQCPRPDGLEAINWNGVWDRPQVFQITFFSWLDQVIQPSEKTI